MAGRDLTKVLKDRYPAETETRDYLDQLATLTALYAHFSFVIMKSAGSATLLRRTGTGARG